jgi:hypothetical protein
MTQPIPRLLFKAIECAPALSVRHRYSSLQWRLQRLTKRKDIQKRPKKAAIKPPFHYS